MQDNTAAFSVVLLQALIAHNLEAGRLRGLSRIMLLSDTGTHFGSYAMLGTIANQCRSLGRAQFQEVGIFWGPEAHFKDLVDGHFSELKRALDQQALEKDVVTEQELCECYTR